MVTSPGGRGIFHPPCPGTDGAAFGGRVGGLPAGGGGLYQGLQKPTPRLAHQHLPSMPEATHSGLWPPFPDKTQERWSGDMLDETPPPKAPEIRVKGCARGLGNCR